MKKILSILIAVALLMTLTVSAFAADTETPVVTVSSATAAEVGEEVTLEVSITATTMAGYALKVVYDAEALELTAIKKGEDAGEGFFSGSKKTGKATYANTYNEDIEGVLFTVTFTVLAEGQHTVSLEVDKFALEDQTIFEVTTVDGVVTVGDVGGEEPEGGEGEIIVETTDTYGYFDMYSMTAPATGTYTFSIPAGLGVWSYDSYMSWGQPEIDFYDNTEGFELVMDLTEGEVFEFYVGATTRGTWTITYTYITSGEGGEGGEDPAPELPDPIELPLNTNISIEPDMLVVYQHTATDVETLTLQTYGFIMGDISIEVQVNDGATVTMIANDQLTLDLVAGDVVTVVVNSSGYSTLYTELTTGGDEPIVEGSDLTIGNNQIEAADVTYIYTAGENGTLTLSLGGAIMGPVEATVKVNGEVVGTLYTNTELVLELNAGDEVVIEVVASGYSTLTAAWTTGGEDVECEHEYVDGVCIHCGEEDPNYQPPTQEPDGTQGNPFIIEQLPYEATQETNDDFYYQWTATENGTLYVYYTDGLVALSGSSLGSWDYAEGGRKLAVAAGDVITINYWSGTGFTVEFVADSGEAEPGTQGNPIAIDSLNITLTINDDGIYYAWTATEAGEVVIRVAETTWSYGYSLTINGESLFGAGSELTFNVEAGDQIVIVIVVYPSASSDGHLTLEQVVEEEHVHNHVISDSKDATCTEDGYVTYTCECGDSYTETVPATGHSYVDGVCEHCGEADPDYVPECEHNYVDGVCTNCGEADPDYNPETGSLNVMAIALIAVMSLTAVVVTTKKSDEE